MRFFLFPLSFIEYYGYMPKFDPLMTPARAAAVLLITPVRLAQIAAQGQIPCEFTPGGHRRYRESVVYGLLVKIEIENGVEAD